MPNVILPRIDTANVDQLDSAVFPSDFKNWLSTLVDTLNTALQLIEADLP